MQQINGINQSILMMITHRIVLEFCLNYLDYKRLTLRLAASCDVITRDILVYYITSSSQICRLSKQYVPMPHMKSKPSMFRTKVL